MAELSYEVSITLVNPPGVLKALAIIKFRLPIGALILHGFSVVEQPDKELWVEFPQEPATEVEGLLRDAFAVAIVDAYIKANLAQDHERNPQSQSFV